jgi:hypothetical protein
MTIGAVSQCDVCAHFRSPFAASEEIEDRPTPKCAAFPDGIPQEIITMRFDHREPFEGDHGIQWKSDDGAPYPEESLAGKA